MRVRVELDVHVRVLVVVVKVHGVHAAVVVDLFIDELAIHEDLLLEPEASVVVVGGGSNGQVFALVHRGPIGGLEDLSGLAYGRPMPAILLTFFLTSLAGLPLTAGFWGKWLLVRSVIGFESGWPALTILVSSAVLIYAYFRWVAVLFMRSPRISIRSEASSSELAILALCAGLTLWLGLMPDPVLGPAGERLLEYLSAVKITPS